MKHEKELLKKIDYILRDFSDYEKATVNYDGDIVIKSKINIKKEKKNSILTNVFKEIIANDIKKNRV